MDSVVSAVEITFENIDTILIPAHYFKWFSVKNLRTDISFCGTNTLHKVQTAECLKFCLEKAADKNCKNGDMAGMTDPDWGLFDRLTERSDITQLTLFYSDGSSEDIHVPWLDLDEAHEYDSRYQHAKLQQDGSLAVLISENQEDTIDAAFYEDD